MNKYTRLYNSIKEQIETGALKKGGRLPSLRKAADICRVSLTTVKNAYFDLCADGYIAPIDKSGYFVTYSSGVSETAVNSDSRQDVLYDFSGGIADNDCFDLPLWQRYVKSALHQKDRLLSYSMPSGEYDLRAALAEYIYRKRNIITTPDRIIIGAGVQPLLHIICSLTDKSKCVSFPDRSFRQGISVFEDYGFNVHTRDKNADIIYVSPSHMTRWGDVMPIKRRLELIEYSQKNGSLVIEDDYENEFLYNSRPTPSLFALGKGNIIYIGSFSAMLLPGIRISFMVLTKELKELYDKNSFKYAQTASMTEQMALCNFIRDGHIYSQTRRIRRRCTAKNRLFYNLLRESLPGFDIKISENMLQIIIKTKSPIKSCDFERSKIKLFMADEQTLVLSPGGVNEADFKKACNIIGSILT